MSGKIAVIGGCREYTGAPYFAAISALKIVSSFFFHSFSLLIFGFELNLYTNEKTGFMSVKLVGC